MHEIVFHLILTQSSSCRKHLLADVHGIHSTHPHSISHLTWPSWIIKMKWKDRAREWLNNKFLIDEQCRDISAVHHSSFIGQIHTAAIRNESSDSFCKHVLWQRKINLTTTKQPSSSKCILQHGGIWVNSAKIIRHQRQHRLLYRRFITKFLQTKTLNGRWLWLCHRIGT